MLLEQSIFKKVCSNFIKRHIAIPRYLWKPQTSNSEFTCGMIREYAQKGDVQANYQAQNANPQKNHPKTCQGLQSG